MSTIKKPAWKTSIIKKTAISETPQPETKPEEKVEEKKPEIVVPVEEKKPEIKQEVKPEIKVPETKPEEKKEETTAPRPRLRVSLKSTLPNLSDQPTTPQFGSGSNLTTPQPVVVNSPSNTINSPMIVGIKEVEEEEDKDEKEEKKPTTLSSSGAMLTVDSFSKKRSTSVKRDPTSKSLETYEEIEEVEILNALYQIEGLQEAKKEEKSIRDLSILDENPLPTLSEEIYSFEISCGTFERTDFLFTEKALPTRKNKPVSFFSEPQIEEMEKLFVILTETKPPPPEKIVRTQSYSLQKSSSMTGSTKNLNDLRKVSSGGMDPEQDRLLKARQQGSRMGSILRTNPQPPKNDIEYSPDFEPPFMNPLYDPNALSEQDQKKKNLNVEIDKVIESYEGVDIEMMDVYNLDLDELPTLSEEIYSNFVRRIAADLRFEKKEKNIESKEKTVFNPNSVKKNMNEVKKVESDDYEDGDTSLASKKNPAETVKKLLIEVRNLKKRLQLLENFVEHDDDFLEDKAILTDYNSFDVTNTDFMEEISVNPMFCDDEIVEHFQVL